jgi:outer membrane receptor protein involved in Fe transport
LRQRRAGGKQRLAGFFLQDLLDLSNALQITLGARFDYWKNTDGFRLETDRDGGIRRSEVYDDRDDTALSPKLAALYKLTARSSMRGSLYRSFRAPTINELYRPFRVRNDITEANADLVSETLSGAELGFDYSGPTYFGRLTAFWNRVDDPIANVTIAEAESPGVIDPCGFVPAGGSCRQRQNLGQTRIVGFEAELEVNLAKSWGLSASYLISDGEVIDAPNQPALDGKSIAQVPEHQVTLGLVYNNRRLFGSRLQARYVGSQFEDDLNTRELDDYLVVDLSVWKKIKANLDLFLGVENLFDQTFEVGKSADGLVTIGSPLRVHLGVRLQ